jgi:hypothetical protein
MPDGFDIPQDFSDPALIDALRSKRWPAESLELLAQLRRRVNRNRTALERHAAEFDKAFDDAARGGLDANGLVRLAEKVLEAQRGAAEQLYPWMEALSQTRAPQSELGQEAQQHLNALQEVAVAWLTTYQTLHERLLKLASQQLNSGEILRVRPVSGDVDYAELSREHIARYPKIRAALAK